MKNTMMMNREFSEQFAREWIDAWNSHDLDRILSHYTNDFEMSSPYIREIAGEPSGTLSGKLAIGQYWATALEKMPHLRFELIDVLTGVNSIVIYYRGVRGMAAEMFIINAEGKVVKATAHY